MIDFVRGPFDIRFFQHGLLKEVRKNDIRLTAAGHVYFAAMLGEYIKPMQLEEQNIDDEIAFQYELGLIDIQGGNVKPLPLGLKIVFKDLEFDDAICKFSVEMLKSHPEIKDAITKC